MLYICEIETCTKRTSANFCKTHVEQIRNGADVKLCAKCGVVTEIVRLEGGAKRVEFIEECYVCKGKQRKDKYPWEELIK